MFSIGSAQELEGTKKNPRKATIFGKTKPNNSLETVYLLYLLEIVEVHCEFVVAFSSEILILG